jgi:hypothetical protein
MNKRLVTGALVAALLAAGALGVTAASALTPLGYRYGSCSGTVGCPYEGLTNASQAKIALSATKVCPTGAEAVSLVGYVPIKHGKFSVNKTVKALDGLTERTFSVKVQLSGTFKPRKSVVGTFEFTTTDTECTAESGKLVHFSMKYKGPFYGG